MSLDVGNIIPNEQKTVDPEIDFHCLLPEGTLTCLLRPILFLNFNLYRNEYRNLQLSGSTMGRGLGRSEED
jgi:hypothetical protein